MIVLLACLPTFVIFVAFFISMRKLERWRQRTRLCKERAAFFLAMRDEEAFIEAMRQWEHEITRGP